MGKNSGHWRKNNIEDSEQLFEFALNSNSIISFVQKFSWWDTTINKLYLKKVKDFYSKTAKLEKDNFLIGQ